MRAQHVRRDGDHDTWLLAFDIGDRVMETLEEWARERGIEGAHFHALGAFRRATLAWYDLEEQQYEEHDIDEQLEVCSLVGNVSVHQGKTKIHAHAVLGRRDVSTVGGHLIEAEVRPTLELTLTTFRRVERGMVEEVGLPLL